MKPNPLTPKPTWKPHGKPHLPTLTPDQHILKDKRKTHENTLEDDLIKMGMAPVAKTLRSLDSDVFHKSQG
jgi:hypothetical protein